MLAKYLNILETLCLRRCDLNRSYVRLNTIHNCLVTRFLTEL